MPNWALKNEKTRSAENEKLYTSQDDGPILSAMTNNRVLIHGHALGFKVFSQGMSNVGTPWNMVVVYIREHAKNHSL